MKTLVLLHTADFTLPKAALETLTAAKQLGAPYTVALMGPGAQASANLIANCGAERFHIIENEALAAPRYSSDTAAAAALIKASGADIILAPGTTRYSRALPGVAARIGAQIDTRIVGLTVEGDTLHAQRWYYRQRIYTTITRAARPWIILLDTGVYAPFGGIAAGEAACETVPCDFPAARTTINGVQKPAADEQTIRPDAQLLFVAGAGWTKKQRDGSFHGHTAAVLIKEFLGKSDASLGSSKSIIDLQSEGGEALSFISHMNQIGQTGSTPRHPKGLSTCCHGEEPHVVGWRFINERRAINLDPNCGWAQGKADVLYVADAFAVMNKLNTLL